MRVFVIDPAPFQRRILGLLLEARGIVGVEGHATPDEIVDPARPGDLVFCDATMIATGIPRALSGARVVATGPEKADDVLAAAVNAGADAFLAKPYTEAGVAAAFHDLDLREAAEAVARGGALRRRAASSTRRT